MHLHKNKVYNERSFSLTTLEEIHMKKIAQIASLSLLAASVQLAHAAPNYNFAGTNYGLLSFGEYFTDSNRNMSNSPYGSIGLGHNFTNLFAVQTQLGYFQPALNSPNQKEDSYLWTVDARLNGRINNLPLVPYVIAGPGLVNINQGGKFVINYGVGLDMQLSPNVSFGGLFSQVWQTNTSRSLDSMLTGTFTYTFGNVSMIPSAAAATAPKINNQQQMLQKAQTTLKPILPAGVELCKNGKLGNQAGCVTIDGDNMVMHLNVRFLQNKANIQNKYTTSIASLGNFMNAYPDTTVVLYGYASSEGPAAFNQSLSLQRAVSVQNYLVTQKHIAKSRTQVVGMGIKNPIAPNSTLQGRQTNRRVEATVPVPYNLDH